MLLIYIYLLVIERKIRSGRRMTGRKKRRDGAYEWETDEGEWKMENVG